MFKLNCSSQPRKLVLAICIPCFVLIAYIIWNQNALYYEATNEDDMRNFLNQFLSENETQNDLQTQYTRYKMHKKTRISSGYIKQIIHNMLNTGHAQEIQITKNECQPMTHIQHVINAYVDELSTKDYDTFNSDIFIQNMTFHHLSFEFLFSAISNKTILFHGDSFCRKFWRFVAFAMHQKYKNNTANMHNTVQHGIFTSLINGDINNTLNQSLTINKQSASWLLEHEMHKIGVATHKQYKIDQRTKEQLWYTVFEKYYIKLLLIAHTLRDDPYVYDDQFKQLNEPLDVLFINFQALHMTHLLPARTFEPHAISMIKNLEYHFDKVVDIAVHSRNDSRRLKCVIFRPPNPICVNMYKKEWVKLSEFYEDKVTKMNESELKDDSKIRKCLTDYRLNDDEIYYGNNVTNVTVRGIDICSKYSITQIGVEAIDDRIKKYVFNKQNGIYDKYGVKLIYYDQIKLFRNHCDKTYDGRHYIELLPVETVAVFNIVDKWC